MTSGFSGRTTKELTWKCIESCGACCKIAKDFAFATPDEIFDDPDDVELYRSMIGEDGWYINYDKYTRKCSHSLCFENVHCSLAHPYLLADNRHYPFYLWRKIINAHWLMRYLLDPFYVYSWFSILTLLAKTRRKIWVLVYFLATCGVLVPTPLIEFRYYTIPFYLFMLHSCVKSSSFATWLLIGTIFVCINVFTMAMFLFRPFKWSHEDGVQRFIW